MNTLIITGHQIRLLSKSPGILFVMFMAPVVLIYLFGLVFSSLIYDPVSGLNATDYFGSTFLSLGILQGSFIASWGLGKEERNGAVSGFALPPFTRKQYCRHPSGNLEHSLHASFSYLFTSRFILSASYAPSLPWVLIIIAALSFFSCAFGLGLPSSLAE
jgi:hypothetical protein